MDTIMQDLRHALRSLRRSPSFTIAALLTLALGIGANTAVFSVVESVLLRTLPYPDGEHVAVIWSSRPNQARGLMAIADIDDFRAQSRTLASIGVVRQQSVNLTGRDRPDRLTGAYVDADALTLLGAHAAVGRLFTQAETAPATATDVAVLSHAAWRTRFGGDSGLVGKTLVLDGRSRTVIGVTSEGFSDPLTSVDVWLPVGRAPSATWFNRGVFNVWAYARLLPSVDPRKAQDDLSAIAARIANASPTTNAGVGVAVVPLRDQVVGAIQPFLVTLLAFVGIVLLIACANVANLQLARAEGRRRDVMLRSALGAARIRLIRELLTESLVLSATGGVAGAFLASWAVDALVRLSPGGIPSYGATGINPTVLAFTSVLIVVTGIAFGTAPALAVTKPDLRAALSLRPGQSRGRGLDIRDALVAAQLALCVVLLVGAGLLSRTLMALEQVGPGFDADGVLTAEYRVPAARYPTPVSQAQFHEQVLAAVRGVSGVRSAAMVRAVPLTGNFGSVGYQLDGKPQVTPPPVAQQNVISDSFFETLSVRLIAGRDFDARDAAGAPPVVVVNDEFARRAWPGEDALGKRISIVGTPNTSVTVVGVVHSIAQLTLKDVPTPQVYQPMAQAPGTYNSIAIRVAGDPAAYAARLRDAVWSVDPDQPVWRIRPMVETVGQQVAQPRFAVVLTGGFAGLALLLACVGVYGVMSYVFAQRTREMGIRMALGAGRAQVTRLALGRGVRVVAAGALVGLPLAFGAARLLRAQLFGVVPVDPLTFSLVPLVLGATALLACYIPARRAARVDPVVALRED